MARRLEPVPLFGLQAIGLVCLIVAAWNIDDGWYALGVFGAALLIVVDRLQRQR